MAIMSPRFVLGYCDSYSMTLNVSLSDEKCNVSV